MKRMITLRIGAVSGGLELSISHIYLTSKSLIAVSELTALRGGGIASYTWQETAIEIEVKDDARKNFHKLPVDHYVVCHNKVQAKIAHDELTAQNSSQSCSCIWKFFETPIATVQFIESPDEIQDLIKQATLIYSKEKTPLVRSEQKEEKRLHI